MYSKLLIGICYLVAYVSTLFVYVQYIEPTYSYSGFTWNPSTGKIFEGGMIIGLVPFILPKVFDKPSDILLHIQFLFPILPMCVLYGARDEPREYLYYSLIAFLFVLLVVTNSRLRIARFASIPQIVLQRSLLVIAWLIIGSIVAQGGIKFLNFDFALVYELRDAAAENLPGIYGYLSALNSKVILPFSLLLAIIQRDRFLATAAILGSVMMFALTAHKGPLFIPLMVLAIYFLSGRKNVVVMLLLGYMAIVGLSSLSFFLGPPFDWVGNLMLRRTFLVPAHLNFLYYDYFLSNPFTFWAESKMSFGLVESTYNIGTPQLIGWVYYDSIRMSANTGWLGSGYANAGFIGMLIYSIVIGLTMSILDSYSKFVDKRLLLAVSMGPIFVLFTSSDLPSAFLNHGLILTLLVLALLSSSSMSGRKVSIQNVTTFSRTRLVGGK